MIRTFLQLATLLALLITFHFFQTLSIFFVLFLTVFFIVLSLGRIENQRIYYLSRMMSKMFLALWIVEMVRIKWIYLSWAAWILGIMILESGITLLASAQTDKKKLRIWDHSLLQLGFVCILLGLNVGRFVRPDDIPWFYGLWGIISLLLTIHTGRQVELGRLLSRDGV